MKETDGEMKETDGNKLKLGTPKITAVLSSLHILLVCVSKLRDSRELSGLQLL